MMKLLPGARAVHRKIGAGGKSGVTLFNWLTRVRRARTQTRRGNTTAVDASRRICGRSVSRWYRNDATSGLLVLRSGSLL